MTPAARSFRRASAIPIGRGLAALGCLPAALLATACGRAAVRAEVAGPELYVSCAPCHGAAGEGNAALGAPAIAALPAWHVAAQLHRFQKGLRGRHPDDAEGLRMRAMSRQMLSDRETDAVAAHVAALPPLRNAATLHGADKAAGQPLFALCSVCHGEAAEGNADLQAPPLAPLDDWYIASLLRKYRAGILGTAPDDDVGPQMQAVATTIEPASIDHLAAYIHSLGAQP